MPDIPRSVPRRCPWLLLMNDRRAHVNRGVPQSREDLVSLLTLSVLMILRLSVIEFRPWIVGRDKPTAGPESGYGCGRSEARSATMRPVCYLYSFSRTTLTAWSSTSLAPMLMAWSRQQLQREPIALAAPCVAS